MPEKLRASTAEYSIRFDHRLAETRRLLIEQKLSQRSRASRKTMVDRIQKRLTRWNPPQWVLDDLAHWANAGNLGALKTALLLDTC